MQVAGLDLRVAVGAEQHALLRLGARRLERPGHALAREREGLLRRIPVVEVQSAERSVVPAEGTRAAGLLDEEPLDLASPALDGARPA
jgi:hypothetical protein